MLRGFQVLQLKTPEGIPCVFGAAKGLPKAGHCICREVHLFDPYPPRFSKLGRLADSSEKDGHLLSSVIVD